MKNLKVIFLVWINFALDFFSNKNLLYKLPALSSASNADTTTPATTYACPAKFDIPICQ
ncbi:hypothetical protein RchiOBHm_Chr4g0400061 [Rosa chinensis]|uniref:Uncharacterized protein n=1 Tax=Rosa chinensis TaxID=74649 RepID=A0A2P6QSP9_ROSCH|nr:hypothetical protein RchiOBHm_Chr4g0400061 [Rosa chinensis]